MIFDTWGGGLGPFAYREFSLRYIEGIVAGLIKDERAAVPNIVFTKGGGLWLEAIAAIGCDALGLDWTIDLGEARRRVGDKVALQGNLDPSALFGSQDSIRRCADLVLDGFGHGSGHVFNLGHGISQFTDPENVQVLVDTVHSQSRKYHP